MPLLATDLDGTVIPPEPTPARMAEVRAFRRAVEASGVTLAYVTGRDHDLALEGIDEFELPAPDFVACDVGTSLYARTPDGTFRLDEEYRRAMAEALGATGADAVREVLTARAPLRLQPPRRQAEFKASFFAPWPIDASLVDGARAELAARGLSASVVVSRDAVTGEGLVDVLPESVAKDRALLRLREILGLTPEEVVFAGDSGNDRAALLCGCRAIVVGNADPELARRVRADAARLGVAHRLHFARAAYAAAVLEGCRRFGILDGA